MVGDVPLLSGVPFHPPGNNESDWRPPHLDDVGELEELSRLSELTSLLMHRKRVASMRPSELGEYFDLSKAPERSYSEWMAALAKNGLALGVAPVSVRGCPDLCAIAVRENGAALNYVPRGLRGRSLCLSAVMKEGLALLYVPAEHRDATVCLVAVSDDGRALGFVPNEMRDYNLCKAAISNNGLALKFVPPERLDTDFCLTAIRQDTRAMPFALERNPHLLSNANLRDSIRESSRVHLEMIPPSFLSEELCLRAVRLRGKAISRVPGHLLTPEVIRAALISDPMALGLLPEVLRKYQFCELAVAHHGAALQFVPSQLIGLALCRQAIASHPPALDLIPQHLCDNEMINFAAERGYRSVWLGLGGVDTGQKAEPARDAEAGNHSVMIK